MANKYTVSGERAFKSSVLMVPDPDDEGTKVSMNFRNFI